ncbi:AMP-binding enzyme [Actinomadura physcomitrii]|uniref:AMP-binding enzyme n=1 Tax=Actinomadura physcomitrii TaxID=2650748 RepID=UPI002E263BE2
MEEVAVVGVPDAMMGQKVGAVVVLRPGEAVRPGEIIGPAGERLADFKIPQYVVLQREPLPRNAAGKVDKALLRARSDWGPVLR